MTMSNVAPYQAGSTSADSDPGLRRSALVQALMSAAPPPPSGQTPAGAFLGNANPVAVAGLSKWLNTPDQNTNPGTLMPNALSDIGAVQPAQLAGTMPSSPWDRFKQSLSGMFSNPGMGGGAAPPPMGMGAPPGAAAYPGYLPTGG